jgi:hypothetical protein
MKEYFNRRMTIKEMIEELNKLIKKYNEKTESYLIIYVVNFQIGQMGKTPIDLSMDDYYTIKDVLREDGSKKLSFYIETPGGSGIAAEEIAKFLRNKYDEVNFIIAGECKSAGTILAMCGDISMSETGSLGPIDAQITIGRSPGSAYDYMEWFNEKLEDGNKNKINPAEEIMLAQISPQELKLVHNSLEYGKELVIEFLSKYKFKDLEKINTSEKKTKAEKIANELSNHSKWRTHGRSLKIEDLKGIGLNINNLNKDKNINEIIERIHVLKVNTFF